MTREGLYVFTYLLVRYHCQWLDVILTTGVQEVRSLTQLTKDVNKASDSKAKAKAKA